MLGLYEMTESVPRNSKIESEFYLIQTDDLNQVQFLLSLDVFPLESLGMIFALV